MSLDPRLDHVSIVLFEPQDDINIGTTVRACKNFGIRDIRLVRPAKGDPRNILISAPNAEDVIDNLHRFESLEEALADCAFVIGTTSRRRKNKRLYLEPRGAAIDVVAATEKGRVALLFGREDHGLPNEALSLCHATVTIPTSPDYASLNLGQAVLLLAWEVFRVANDTETTRGAVDYIRAESEHDPASLDAINRLFEHADRALTEIEFLKPETHDHMLTTLREMFLRAGLDTREVSIWHGIFSQIDYALERERRRGDSDA